MSEINERDVLYYNGGSATKHSAPVLIVGDTRTLEVRSYFLVQFPGDMERIGNSEFKQLQSKARLLVGEKVIAEIETTPEQVLLTVDLRKLMTFLITVLNIAQEQKKDSILRRCVTVMETVRQWLDHAEKLERDHRDNA